MEKNRVLTQRRTFLLGLGTLGCMGAVGMTHGIRLLNQNTQVFDEESYLTASGKVPLHDRSATKGLLYGAAASYRRLTTDRAFAARFAQECNILVPEWELKWGTLRPSPDRFNFVPGDWLLKFARQHNMLFRGHTLVWHEALPAWFAEKVDQHNAEQVLQQHITRVAGHFAGKIHSWDVVNEAILTQDGRSDGLRTSPWLQFLGSNYIDIAFHTAAAADPQALLVYNETNLEYDTREDEARRINTLKLLERLKSRGTPVHALGVEGHLRGDERRFNSKKFRAFLHDVASLGLKILITEMDVTDQKLPKDPKLRDRIVAEIYEDYLSVVLDEPAVIAVLTWGLSDRYTWLSKEKPRKDRAPVRPLPLDAQLNRKLAWNAIARAFDNAPQR